MTPFYSNVQLLQFQEQENQYFIKRQLWACKCKNLYRRYIYYFYPIAKLLSVFLLTFSILCQPLCAQTPPAGFSSVVVSSPWNEAVGIVFSKDGKRMFVWERIGRVWVVENGQKQLLIDISEEVGAWHDHGLLGFTLHPQFEQNGYFYLLYLVDRHYLMNFGKSTYNSTSNDYYSATIGRLTRYTAIKTTTGYSVANRKILLGETASTGIPSLERSHVTGSVLFGTDGTLLISTGDGAHGATTDAGGNVTGSYAPQGLADGIITAKEDVGAFRAQLLECLNGKILRIDPETGQGIPSNPFFELTNPGSVRSKVWALGLRNPFRMSLKPGSGSHMPEDANPGVLYIGDVGYYTWEELSIVDKPGINLGWPIFEGLTHSTTYSSITKYNYYAPNPLYGVNGCTQEYFYFQDLLKQATASGSVSFTNPCNTAQGIPSTIKTFMHTRPIIDWHHNASGPSRTGIFNGETASTINIGATGSPVSGPQFGGTSSTGGVFYTGDDFPEEYKNTYFVGDFGRGWIRNVALTSDNKPLAVKDFINSGATVVYMTTHPIDGSLYYINFGSEIRKVYYSANRPPQAVATADKTYGPSPLSVQFTGSNSSDPEGQALRYEWNFGDGSTSTALNPSHVYNAATGIPTKYTVTLKVTDNLGSSDQTTIIVSANNSPPQVSITSPANNTLYSVSSATTYALKASVQDTEHSGSQLSYQWLTTLHHNDHIHPEPIDTNPETTATLDPLGCEGETYYYSIKLTVTDAAGLSASNEVKLYPNCNSLPANASNLAATALNGQVRLSWVNPSSTFDEVMIVAKHGSAITGTPSGDGSTYSANLNYTASSSFFDGGKVVYKGKTSPQTVTNLTNNTLYYFKVFTRVGTNWSDGIQTNATPFAPIIQELWTNFTGTSVAAIPVSTPPTSTSELTQFEAPLNIADSYGRRIRAYLHVQVTGSYTFYIASDDDSELWLSTSDNPTLKQKIASVSGWTNSREWTKFASQKSATISLQAGQKYYIEALHREGAGGDNLAVAWQTPTNATITVIAGAVLSPVTTAPANQAPTVALTSPANGASFTAPASITLAATATDNDGSVTKVEFFSGATKLGEDLTSPYSYSWSNVAAGTYTLTAKASDNAGAVTTSSAIGISVTTTTFYRAINFNGNTLSIDGRTYEASATAANFSYTGGVLNKQNVTLIPATDPNRASMIRSSITSQATSPATMNVGAVPSGTYEMYIYVWEDKTSKRYNLLLEGQTIVSNYTTGSGGTWAKLGPFRTSIADGAINLTASGGPANVSGIEIWKVNVTSSQTTTARLQSEENSGNDQTVLQVFPNPFYDVLNIEFSLKESDLVKVAIYSSTGKLLNVLFEGHVEAHKKYSLRFEQENYGNDLYFIRLLTEKEVYYQKIMKFR